MSHAIAVEIVEFKLVKGTDAAVFLAINDKVAPRLAELAGFIERQLVANEDGLWLDMVKWTDMHAAKAAAEQVMKIDGFADFMQLLDMDSVKMLHFETKYTS